MREKVFGRAGEPFPRVLLSLSVPHEGFAEGGIASLVGAAAESGLPLDVGSQPALWGGALRSRSASSRVVSFGGAFLERATDEGHAADLTQAHLIETLSSLGRETLDVYVLTLRRPLEETVIGGALSALESARQEGHVRLFGLHAEGSGLAALGLWTFHDFAEMLFVPDNPLEAGALETLGGLADERRVGIVGLRPLAWRGGLPAPVVAAACGIASEPEAARELLRARRRVTLVGVRTVAEVEIAARIADAEPAESPPWVSRVAAAYEDRSVLERIALDARPAIARAATRLSATPLPATPLSATIGGAE